MRISPSRGKRTNMRSLLLVQRNFLVLSVFISVSCLAERGRAVVYTAASNNYCLETRAVDESVIGFFHCKNSN